MYEHRLFYERHLPHYQPPGATLFLTFRLAGSLPQTIIADLQSELKRTQLVIGRLQPIDQRAAAVADAQKRLFARIESELDRADFGPRWLQEPGVAQIVSDALHYRDGRVYQLDAFCIMPNHVHLICTPLIVNGSYISIAKMMQSLKGFTARKANEYLGRCGDFWQHESYDHVVRDPMEYDRIIAYVLQNPVKAGLPADWVYCRANC